MHSHHTVVDLALVAVVLPRDGDGFFAALADAGLVHATDGLAMRVILSHDLLAAVSQFLFIPLDRFEKALQGTGLGLELERDGFGVLALQIGELSFDINEQQLPGLTAAETIGEQGEKRNQLPSQGGNLF